MQKALVTGVSGMIGSRLAETLIRMGVRVVGVDTHPCPIQGVDFLCADIRDRQAMYEAAKGIDAIAHLAGLANVRNAIGKELEYFDVNVHGSINMLDAAVKHAVPSFVFASTSSVYGRSAGFKETEAADTPLSAYPASKRSVELLGHSYHNNYQLNFTATRFFSVYGPRPRTDMMPCIVAQSIKTGSTIDLYNGGQMWRDWTHVDDICDGVIRAMINPLGYEIINLGRGKPVMMGDFVGYIERAVGGKAKIRSMPAPPTEAISTCADIGKAVALLGYNPTISLENADLSFLQ